MQSLSIEIYTFIPKTLGQVHYQDTINIYCLLVLLFFASNFFIKIPTT